MPTLPMTRSAKPRRRSPTSSPEPAGPARLSSISKAKATGRTMHEDEELAAEFLLGTPGPKGRIYLKPGSELELKARAILARLMLAEAPAGYFTRLVAALIDP